MTPQDANKRKPGRLKGNKFTTRSGKTIKVRQTLTEKSRVRREAKALRKAERMRGMPKSRFKRLLFKMHPKRLAKYWFSRDGLIMALKITGIAIVVGFFALMAMFAYFRKDLPNIKDISGSNIGGSIRYYDRTGNTLLWEDYDAVKRTPVTDENISPYLKAATVAIEDRDFFKHSGFNLKGITRAAWNNAFGGNTQGGSTITQQLVKLTNDDFKERTLTVKIKELILSMELERTTSKKDILVGYLNAAPYGGIEYGVDILVEGQLASSKSEARRFLESNAVYINGMQFAAAQTHLQKHDSLHGFALVRRGKNQLVIVELK